MHNLEGGIFHPFVIFVLVHFRDANNGDVYTLFWFVRHVHNLKLKIHIVEGGIFHPFVYVGCFEVCFYSAKKGWNIPPFALLNKIIIVECKTVNSKSLLIQCVIMEGRIFHPMVSFLFQYIFWYL